MSPEALIELRCYLYEHGLLHSAEPLPGQGPAMAILPPPNQCPECRRPMEYMLGRRAFICLKCQHHPVSHENRRDTIFNAS